MTSQYNKVSVHGGHSGQFCHHAKDSLQEVIEAYIKAGFTWVGITEHMPPLDEDSRYPDEAESNITANSLQEQFKRYFTECRLYQEMYSAQIRLFTAFETETYAGSAAYVRTLIAQTKPDYIVGSVHHVGGIGIDFSQDLYKKAIAKAGDIEQLYCQYFDEQFTMLEDLEPSVVGHFDLIRIFDQDYLQTIQLASVQSRVSRNLELIADLKLIMDFNLRGFDKSTEQYPCMPILKEAIQKGVIIVPGDDSHGVSSVGRNYKKGVSILSALGHNCQWTEPKLYSY